MIFNFGCRWVRWARRKPSASSTERSCEVETGPTSARKRRNAALWPLVETGEQRQVVVTGERRMRLAARQDAFGVGQEQLLDRGEPGSPLGRPVAAGQHRRAQQRDQAVGLLGMPGAVRFERILGPRVHALGQAHEHLGKVIERLGGLPAQQGRREAQAALP